ncbi:MAG: class I SAM-dependent methyltransferase [Acidobacteriia bacterium]|nr:class I SAM-dependent methyltransferase [Terriglobia bacterium]
MPTGLLGRVVLCLMNQTHSKLTSWGLEYVLVARDAMVLDIGCGGGRTVQRLADMADQGKVFGIDYAETSVAAARPLNPTGIASGQVAIQQATVSQLPSANNTFHLVTAIETHYYWPNHLHDLGEIYRVLRPGGSLLLIAEAFRGQRFDALNGLVMKFLGAGYLTAAEHSKLLEDAGYLGVQVVVDRKRGWLCVSGKKTPEA